METQETEDYEFEVGDSVLCYDNNQYLYEAICRKRRKVENEIQYFLHYKKFNSRFDRWVDSSNLLSINPINLMHKSLLESRNKDKRLRDRQARKRGIPVNPVNNKTGFNRSEALVYSTAKHDVAIQTDSQAHDVATQTDPQTCDVATQTDPQTCDVAVQVAVLDLTKYL